MLNQTKKIDYFYGQNITDEDPNTQTISITDSDGGHFTLDAGLNLSLQSGIAADYEHKSSYLIELTLVDNGGYTLVDTLTLNITDINEAPTAINISNTTRPIIPMVIKISARLNINQ